MNKLKEKLKNKLGEKKTAALKKALNIARIVKNVVCWTLVAILTLAIVVFMVTKLSGGSPQLFGYSIHRIVSGSMEPALEVGDVIINKAVSDPSDIKYGDIVTFKGDADYDNQRVTHRVVTTPFENSRGEIVLVTKGDANEVDDGEIDFNNVESKYLTKAVFLKSIYDFFFSKWGLIVFIALLLLIFFDEIVNIVKLIVAGRQEEEKPESLYEVIERLQREKQAEAEQLKGVDADAEESEALTDADAVENDALSDAESEDTESLQQEQEELAPAPEPIEPEPDEAASESEKEKPEKGKNNSKASSGKKETDKKQDNSKKKSDPQNKKNDQKKSQSNQPNQAKKKSKKRKKR